MSLNYLLRSLPVFLLLFGEAYGQNYNTRMNLASVDTLNRVACYDLEFSSGGTGWELGSFNLSIFYDASRACYRSDSLLLNDQVNSLNILSMFNTTNLSNLPYRDSLGFLRISLDAVSQAADFDTLRQLIPGDGTWRPVVRICYDLKFDNILDPTTCMQLNFNTPVQAELGARPDIVTQHAGGFIFLEIPVNQVENIVPDRTRNACFVLYENTQDLCTDGIDNDENGLTDCLDTEGCAPSNVTVALPNLSCSMSTGDLIFSGTADGMYSVNGGQNFGVDSIFLEIGPGLYDVVIQKNNVTACAWNQPVIVPQPNCEDNDIACSDGIDNDEDGLIDCDDSDCIPILPEIMLSHPSNCPELNNGAISIVTDTSGLELSIDNGSTFQLGEFADLSPGDFSVLIQNSNTLCQSSSALITLNRIICEPPIDTTITDTSTMNIYLANALRLNSNVNGRLSIRLSENQAMNIESFEVYDRWGNQVHNVGNINTDNPSHAWNGTFNGQFVSPGVYFYRALLLSGSERFSLSGDVTVIN